MRRKYNAYGTYLGCRPEEDGMTRCTWEIDEYIPGKGRPYLGRRAKLTDTPKVFQKLFKKYEKLWNNAIAKNTEKAWEKWNLA